MSFGKSPDDYRELAGTAHATLLSARKASGDGDALTLNISSLHHVLLRLSSDVEATEKEGGVRKREDDNRWRELATLARDCARLLKVLNQVLGKYNNLSDEKKKVTKLWRRVKFGNGEVLDLDKIEGEMSTYTQAISLFLGLVEKGPVGKIEGYMDNQSAELREVKHTLHWVIAKMLALEGGEQNGVLRNWKNGGSDGRLWKVIRKELSSQGWAPTVLVRHQKVIVRYVMELGERGVLHTTAADFLDSPSNRGLSELNLGGSSVKFQHAMGSESESDSSLDEESGHDLPLGRRRSSTVSAEQKSEIAAIELASRKRSLDEIDSYEDEFEDDPAPVRQHTVAKNPPRRLGTSTLLGASTHHSQGQLKDTDHNGAEISRHEIEELSPAMALSISSLPPLPLSRPRSRNSEVHAADENDQAYSTRMDAVHQLSSKNTSTTESVVPSGRTSAEMLSSQTLSISSLPPLPSSRPRSSNSNYGTAGSTTSSLSNQRDTTNKLPMSHRFTAQSKTRQPLTTSERFAHVNRGSDTNSEDSSASDDKLKRPKTRTARELVVSALPLDHSEGLTKVVSQVGQVQPSRFRKIQDREAEEGVIPTITDRVNEPTGELPLQEPKPSVQTRPLQLGRPSTLPESSERKDLSKSETIVRPSLTLPVIFKEPASNSIVSSPIKKGHFANDVGGSELQKSISHHSQAIAAGNATPGMTDHSANSMAKDETSSSARQIRPATTTTQTPAQSIDAKATENRQKVEARAQRFLGSKSELGLKSINSESSIARPQIPRTTSLTYSNIIAPRRRATPTRLGQSIVVGLEHGTPKADLSSKGQPLKDEENFPAELASALPPFISSYSTGFHHELDAVETEKAREIALDGESSSDESEQSYLIIKGAYGSQVSFDEEPECIQAEASQTGSLENLTSESAIDPDDTIDMSQSNGMTANSSDLGGSDVEGQSYMNAWSVVLSQVGDDPESTLLETSDVWAHSNPTNSPSSAQKLARRQNHEGAAEKGPVGQQSNKNGRERVQPRSRNVTLVGDSDDEPRPPKASELWSGSSEHMQPTISIDNRRPVQQTTDEDTYYESDSEESLTVPGDSENETQSPLKGLAVLGSVALPVVSHELKMKKIVQDVMVDSEPESSEEDAMLREESAQISARRPSIHDEDRRTAPAIHPKVRADDPMHPVHFRVMDYQSEIRAPKHRVSNTSELGPRGEAQKPTTSRGKSKPTAVVAERSWNKEAQNMMQEFHVSKNGMKQPSRTAKETSSSSSSSSPPVLPRITPSATSKRTWWWSSNKAARAKYQPTMEEVDDEDFLPGAHPNCWSNDSDEFNRTGGGMKRAASISNSMLNDTKPHLAWFANPFKEHSTARGYRIDATMPRHPSDDEASSFGFPSSDENEDVRKYRLGKQIVYEDSDMSFNSALDESSDLDIGSYKEERVEATDEQKEAFKRGIKADHCRKKRYRLEKEAVWGSASEREERRKVRSMRKKEVEAPKITGGKKTVTFEIDERHEARLQAQRAERAHAREERCRVFVEDVRDEEFLPGAHPNCDPAADLNENGESHPQQEPEMSTSIPSLVLKARPNNTSVSPSKSTSTSRQARPRRGRNMFQMPPPDDDKDEDLRRYRNEEAAQPVQEDAAPSWRSSRAYRNKKNKQRRFSHGEDEKFWDEPSSWGGEAGSSEDDWGETYRSDNSRNSSRAALGGCTCCVAEAQTRRRRQHHRSPPVIHHPELQVVNPFLPDPAATKTVATVPQQHSRRRSSIDPWSPDPPTVRRHRREKASESPTYHVPDAPPPVLNSTRPELPARRRTENAETSPQATARPELSRRRTENTEGSVPAVKPEMPRRTIRTPTLREHSPVHIRLEVPRRNLENPEVPLQAARPDIGRRRGTDREQSPIRFERRRMENTEGGLQIPRPEQGRRRVADRDHSPEIPRRQALERERIIEKVENAIQTAVPEPGRRNMVRQAVERERITEKTENIVQTSRPEPGRRTTAHREHSPEKPRRQIVEREQITDSTETTIQSMRPESGRRKTADREQSPVRPERRIANREHSPQTARSEMPRRQSLVRGRTEITENPAQTTRLEMSCKRIVDREHSPDKPRRQEVKERERIVDDSGTALQAVRPEMNRRKTIEREHSPNDTRAQDTRPEMPRRQTVDREHRPPREKLLRFDIK